MQQMIQQRQLDLLLQCAYMEHSRTLARDMEYIQSKFDHVTSNDKSFTQKMAVPSLQIGPVRPSLV